LYPLSKLSNFIKTINSNKLIIQHQKISLKLFKEDFKYDFKIRADCKSTYGIDYSCHTIIKVGTHDSNVINIGKIGLLIYKEKAYENLRDLCIEELGLDFGTYSISPHILFLAPIYIFIEHTSIEDNIIKIYLNGNFEKTSNNIMLLIRGQDILGQNTKLNKVIKQLKPFNNGYEKIEINLVGNSVYIKINLYYKDELTEDFIIRNIKESENEIITSQLEQGSGTIALESIGAITKRKEKIKEKYMEAKSTTNNNLKGLLLEQVISEIFTLVPNLSIAGTRVDDKIQEIDIQVRNFNRENVWYDLDGLIFIECKNWNVRVGSDEIGNFISKLEDYGLKTGIFVAVNDITGDIESGAKGKIKKALSRGIRILTINGNDIDDILNCHDVSKKIDKKYTDIYQ
ncbi:MAG: restriction endonuclease, partial [Nitrososphaeraceae archaeon]